MITRARRQVPWSSESAGLARFNATVAAVGELMEMVDAAAGVGVSAGAMWRTADGRTLRYNAWRDGLRTHLTAELTCLNADADIIV